MQTAFDDRYLVPRRPVWAPNMVATSQPLSAQAGLRMLLKGGNAVDAAIAAAICQSVVEPTSTGVGGDAFAMVWNGAKLDGLNATGRAPKAWTPERFGDATAMPLRGWDSVTVPGAVSAWIALWRRYARLPLATLFEPAIDYARNGFVVLPSSAALWAREAALLADQPGFADTFLPGGRAPLAGEKFSNPALAHSLELIAETEGEAFYSGVLAEKIAAFAGKQGAALSADDLAAHRAEWAAPLSVRFRDVELHEMPPNGFGITALMALGILEHTEIDRLDPDGAEAMHLQIEALKLAFADAHHYIADADHIAIDPKSLLDPDYLRDRARLISPDRVALPRPGTPKHGGTVYVTAADADGMMVSLIQSTFVGFGSGIVVPETGIHLHNRGAAFSLSPGHPNRVGGGKRPAHTIIPGFLTRNGQPHMSFGVVGGPMQPQAHVQLVLRTQLFGQNPQMALDAPRWLSMDGGKVAFENALSRQAVAELERRGHIGVHQTPDNSWGFGGGQIIQRWEGGYLGGTDFRKDGSVVGF